MKQPYVTAVLLIGMVLAGAMFASGVARHRWPDNHQGYSPVQPIAYSHRLHVEELQMDCRYCHSTAMESRHAGIPSGDVCMRCHKFVTASFEELQKELNQADEEQRKPERIVSDELQKLYEAMAVDEEMNPREDKQPQPIPWVRVHNLPDFVYFDHRAHLAAGVSCQHCHGPVESMQQVEQYSSLSMGWCVNCHRDTAEHGVQGQPASPSLDCSVCHY